MRRVLSVSAFVVLLALIPIGLALADGRSQTVAAQATPEGFKPDTNTTRYRAATDAQGVAVMFEAPLDGGESFTDLTSATSSSSSGIGCVTSISVGGYGTVSLGTLHSAASSTVVCTGVRFTYDGTTLRFQSASTVTFTAGATYTVDSLYPSTQTHEFNTHGCAIMKFLFADPSIGTVTPGPAKVW